VVAVCFCMLFFYGQKRRTGQCGSEVIFVCFMEMMCHLVNIIVGEDQLITMHDGKTVNWLRYSSWLITTPVMLIHLSNLESKSAYDKDASFKFLTINQCMIVSGMAGSFATNDAFSYTMFTLGCLFFGWLCYLMYPVFCNAYKHFPEKCQPTIEILAVVFYGSWSSFPILWLLGSEGAGIIGFRASAIGHALADLVSKNLFGYLIWYLRWDKQRQLHKSIERKTILRRAASGDVPRVLILGQPKDVFFKVYIADVCTEAGFVADVVHSVTAFSATLSRMQFRQSKGYSVVIVNAEGIQDILNLEAKQEAEGKRSRVSIRHMIGSVPLIGYTSGSQNLARLDADPQELFEQFQCIQSIVGLTMDKDGSRNQREALQFIIEQAVDERLNQMATTCGSDPRSATHDSLGRVSGGGSLKDVHLKIDIDTFKPKHIKVISPRNGNGGDKGGAGTGRTIKRRRSVVGKLLSPEAPGTKTLSPEVTKGWYNGAVRGGDVPSPNRSTTAQQGDAPTKHYTGRPGAARPRPQVSSKEVKFCKSTTGGNTASRVVATQNNSIEALTLWEQSMIDQERLWQRSNLGAPSQGSPNQQMHVEITSPPTAPLSRSPAQAEQQPTVANNKSNDEAARIKKAIEAALTMNGGSNSAGARGPSESYISEIESYVARNIQRWRTAKEGQALTKRAFQNPEDAKSAGNSRPLNVNNKQLNNGQPPQQVDNFDSEFAPPHV